MVEIYGEGGGLILRNFKARNAFHYFKFSAIIFFRLGLAQKLMDQTAASMVEAFNAKVGI